jgi:hypothetical protein
MRVKTATRDKFGTRITLLDLESYNYVQSLKGSPCPAPACGTCGEPFADDYDFWAHYTVEDIRFPRLGSCPTRL